MAQVNQPTSAGRWIERIRIRNVLAIEDADIRVGRGLKITGRLGSGKTSVLQALRALFDRNARTRMVRLGEEEGEVMLVLSDGTTAARKINDEQSERPRLVPPGGKPMGSPVEQLKMMAPALLLNPVRFAQMDDAQRAKVLAEVFPVDLPQSELDAICGTDVDLRAVDPDGNGLARANQAYNAAYDARHTANGELKQAQASRDAERRKIPEGFDPAAARGLSSESIAQDLARIEHHNRLVVDGANQVTKLEGDEKQLNTAIENLRRELAAKETQMTEVQARLARGREWLANNTHIDPAPARATLQTLDQQRMYLHCFDQAEAHDEQCKEIAERARRLNTIVATLHALPGVLVRRAKIPIDGLTLEDGVMHIRGLPLNNLSEGEKLRIAARVAAAGAKDLKVVCIDGAEAISAKAREQLIDDLQDLGIQVFATVADESDFAIHDLEGNPVEARVSIPPRADADVPSTGMAIAALRPPVRARQPDSSSMATVTTARRPVSAIGGAKALFESAPEDEVLFGEPTL